MNLLHEKIRTQLLQNPDRVVFDAAGRSAPSMSAAELVHLIGALRSSVLKKGATVCVLSNHRPETYLAVLASFFAGATIVPLNPKFPVERLQRILNISEPTVILCDSSTTELGKTLGFPIFDLSNLRDTENAVSVDDALAVTGLDLPAYTMFTSGTTGLPKGVPISHGNLAAYVDSITALIDFPSDARFSQLFDLSFDLSMHDIFVAMATGGTIVPPSMIDLMMPAAYIQKKNIDVWFSVPVLAASAVKSLRNEIDNPLKLALFCGEQLPTDYVSGFRALCRPDAQIWNLYGPTEATIAFTGHKYDPATDTEFDVPIGLPFGQNDIGLLTDDGTYLAPEIGQEGELLLGGPQVFGGYVATDKNPFFHKNGERFYRSGDWVRVEKSGVRFLFRIDDQLKVRGYRIEASEIESTCRAKYAMDQVAVLVAGAGEDSHLVAFYVGTEDAPDATKLGDDLPDYMLPRSFRHLHEMPLNANGKTDRKALRELLS